MIPPQLPIVSPDHSLAGASIAQEEKQKGTDKKKGKTMKKLLLMVLVASGLAFVPVQSSDAQIYVGIPGIAGVGIGGGYYGYPAYSYSGYYPYGYYRPYYYSRPYYSSYYSGPSYYWYNGHRVYYRHHRHHHYYHSY